MELSLGDTAREMLNSSEKNHEMVGSVRTYIYFTDMHAVTSYGSFLQIF